MLNPAERFHPGPELTIMPRPGQEFDKRIELVNVPPKPLPFQKFIRMACDQLGIDTREIPSQIQNDRLNSYIGWQIVRQNDPVIPKTGFGGYFFDKDKPAYSMIGYAHRAEYRFKHRLGFNSRESSDAIGILGRGEMATDNFDFYFNILSAADQELGTMVKELNTHMTPDEQTYQQETKAIAEQLGSEMRWGYDKKGTIYEIYQLPKSGFRTIDPKPGDITLEAIRDFWYTRDGGEGTRSDIYPDKPELVHSPTSNENAYKFIRDIGMVGNPIIRYLIEQSRER